MVLLIFTISLYFISCNDSKMRYQKTKKIADNIYVELFYDGDMLEYYLTDSISFRQFIANTFPEQGRYVIYTVKHNRVIVNERNYDYRDSSDVLLSQDTYYLPQMIGKKIDNSVGYMKYEVIKNSVIAKNYKYDEQMQKEILLYTDTIYIPSPQGKNNK